MSRSRGVTFDPAITARIRGLYGADNWHNLFYLAVDYALIAASIILHKTQPSVVTYLIAILLVGSRMRAFDNLTHEASHKMLFKHLNFNEWAGRLLCAFPVGSSLTTYRQSHMKHHQNLGDRELDPDLVRYRELGVEHFPVSRGELALHLIKVFSLFHVVSYIKGTIKSFVRSREQPRVERLAFYGYWGTIAALLTLFGWWTDFLLYWLVPFVTTFQIIRYLAEISEHGGLYDSDDEIEMVRNNFCNPLWRWIQYPHSDFYHLVHHLYPGVAHFKIAKAHKILMENPIYRQGHHCFGYFFPRQPGWKSTLGEMVKSPEVSVAQSMDHRLTP